MTRATSIIVASERGQKTASGTVILDYAQRSMGQGAVTTVDGREIELALRGSVRLATDDLLVLDDGSCVEVVAAAEPLIEVREKNLSAMARIAWHLGDRHIAAELLPNRIRVKRDDAVETLLASLGAKVAMLEAPFEPEGGAYAPAAQQNAHHHAHDHDHHHHHGHEHGHDHSHHAHDHDHGHAHKHHHHD